MLQNQTILNYKGPIEFKVIETLLQKVKHDLVAHSIKKVLKKRVYNIMVECIENILKHKAPTAKTTIHPYIILEKENTQYLIIAGNLISNDGMSFLQKRLNDIRKLSKEGLLKMYEKQISKEDILMQDGAGLGIITIAIKSDNRIEYSFTPVNQGLSVFELRVTVPFDQY